MGTCDSLLHNHQWRCLALTGLGFSVIFIESDDGFSILGMAFMKRRNTFLTSQFFSNSTLSPNYTVLITTVAAVSSFSTTRNELCSCCQKVGAVVCEDNSISDAGRQESRSVTAWKERVINRITASNVYCCNSCQPCMSDFVKSLQVDGVLLRLRKQQNRMISRFSEGLAILPIYLDINVHIDERFRWLQ